MVALNRHAALEAYLAQRLIQIGHILTVEHGAPHAPHFGSYTRAATLISSEFTSDEISPVSVMPLPSFMASVAACVKLTARRRVDNRGSGTREVVPVADSAHERCVCIDDDVRHGAR